VQIRRTNRHTCPLVPQVKKTTHAHALICSVSVRDELHTRARIFVGSGRFPPY